MEKPDTTASQVESKVQVRRYEPVAGAVTGTPLIYLPGLHGDWTLIGGFRKALAGRAPFVEMTYPRTLTWSLDDYAGEIETALAEQGIRGGWLLAESFGSQVAWALVSRPSFHVRGVILAGGFVRHPALWLVRFAEVIGGKIPLAMITRVLFGYAKVARRRYRDSPEVAAGIQEFIDRRTELDRKAAIHRLHLIFWNDARRTARSLKAPLYAITGWLDPIVPWLVVRRWLRRHCTSLREYRIVKADHNVLGTAPQTSADTVVEWITAAERDAPPAFHVS